MHECIFIHIGEAGIQLASECWKLFCFEHGIFLDGDLDSPGASSSQPVLRIYETSPLYHSFFNETESGKLEPRSILVDLDPITIDETRTGIHRKLFNSNFLIKGQQSSSSIFSCAYFQTGPSIISTVMDQIRIAADQCNSLQGFIIFHSCGGGTGSGLTSLLLQELVEEYPKKAVLDFAIFSSPNFSPITLEPYNSVLYSHTTMDLPICTFLLANTKISTICSENYRIKYPSLTNINRIIAQISSSITSSHRYNGPLKLYLQDFQKNLAPFPRVHFPIISLAPVVRPFDVYKVFTLKKITRLLFHPSYQMVDTEDVEAKYFSSVLMYQGESISTNDYRLIIREAKKTVDCGFVDWYPLNFKFGISNRLPYIMPFTAMGETQFSGCMAASKSSIIRPFQRFIEGFDSLFSKNKYLHRYYDQGMEEEDFSFARENVVELVEDYLKLQEVKCTKKDMATDSQKYYRKQWKLRRNNFKFSLLEKGIWKTRFQYAIKQCEETDEETDQEYHGESDEETDEQTDKNSNYEGNSAQNEKHSE